MVKPAYLFMPRMACMNQNQLSELFATSKQNIGQHIASTLKGKELEWNLVVKNFFTAASDGKRKKYEAKQADLKEIEELKNKIEEKG